MRKSGWTPSIVPLGDLVLDDFGGRIGSAWREANFDAKSTEWLWFGAALLAMTVIALIVSFPR